MSDSFCPERILIPREKALSYLGIKHPCPLIEVKGVDYEEILKFLERRWGRRGGSYANGLINDPEDPQKGERIGALGEVAVAKLFGWCVDFGRREGGDKEDFLIHELKIDVKCAREMGATSYIRVRTPSGEDRPVDKDIYICCYRHKEDRKAKYAEVVIIGYATQEYVMSRPMVRGVRGQGHMNKELPWNELKPIHHLLVIMEHIESLDK